MESNAESEARPSVFVLMPFASEFTQIYREILKPGLEEAGFTVSRADDFIASRNILADVIEGIVGADVVVADISTLNPNVMYELGVAHSLQRPTIMVIQDVEEIPFDLRSYRVVTYSTDFMKIRSLATDVAMAAQEMLRDPRRVSNPVLDFGQSATLAAADDPPNPDGASDSRPAPDDGGDDGTPLGRFDLMELQLSAMSSLNEGANGVQQEIERIGQITQARTAEVTAAAATGSAPGQTARVLALFEAFASDLDGYSDNVSALTDTMEIDLAKVANVLDQWIDQRETLSEEDEQQFNELIDTIEGTVEAMSGAEGGIGSFVAAMDDLAEKNFSRALTRSLRRAARSTRRTMEVLRNGQSEFIRVIRKWRDEEDGRG